jgi:hypothetical protein
LPPLHSCIKASCIYRWEHSIEFEVRAPVETRSREIRADVNCDKGFCALKSYFREARPPLEVQIAQDSHVLL